MLMAIPEGFRTSAVSIIVTVLTTHPRMLRPSDVGQHAAVAQLPQFQLRVLQHHLLKVAEVERALNLQASQVAAWAQRARQHRRLHLQARRQHGAAAPQPQPHPQPAPAAAPPRAPPTRNCFWIGEHPHPLPYNVGSMTHECPFCSALMSAGEVVKNPGPTYRRVSSVTGPVYSDCCCKGTVDLPLLTNPPPPLDTLLSGTTPDSRRFINNSRAYNNSLAMASCYAHVDRSIRAGIQQFKIGGAMHHLMGPLMPENGEQMCVVGQPGGART